MADEALKELLAEYSQRAAEWLSASHDCNPGSKMYARYRGEAEKVQRYADALESALSELARLRGEREWKPIGELADLTPALVGSEGEYPTMAWRTKDGRWAVSEFDALQWTPTHYMTLPDEPPVQSHEEKRE